MLTKVKKKFFFRLVTFKPANILKALLNFLFREVSKSFICHLDSWVQSDENARFADSAVAAVVK